MPLKSILQSSGFILSFVLVLLIYSFMNRREVIVAGIAGAVAFPAGARAQRHIGSCLDFLFPKARWVLIWSDVHFL